jgi:hypothetical protein
MPYKLRKAPKKDLYWVVNKETGKKYSKDPLPKEKAKAQMGVLYAAEGMEGGVSAKVKEEAIAKMSKIRSAVELNAERGITALERAIWWYLHPEHPDTRMGKVRDMSHRQALEFLQSDETESPATSYEERPSFIGRDSKGNAVLSYPSGPPTTKTIGIARRSKIPFFQEYEVNQLREKTSVYATERPDGEGDVFSPWFSDWGANRSQSLRALEDKEKGINTRPFSIQHRRIKVNGNTNEIISTGPTQTFYTPKTFKAYIDSTPETQLKGGRKGGAATPTKGLLQQMAVASYSSNPPQNIGEFKLVKQSPTLKFYYDEPKRFMVVAIRGTKLTDQHDLIADALAVSGNLKNSYRYKNDLRQLREVKKLYPNTRFFGVGHSLGGAILDLFLRNGLIAAGMSYNGFPEPQERQGNPLHHRIYHTGDFIYKMFASKIPNIELRTTSEPFWKHLLKFAMPIDVFTGVDRHMLERFKGGLLL